MNNEAIIQSAKKKIIFFPVRSFPIQQRVIFFLCSVFWSHRKKKESAGPPFFATKPLPTLWWQKRRTHLGCSVPSISLRTHSLHPWALLLSHSLSQTDTHIGCAHTHWLNHTRTQARKILAFPFLSIPAYQRQFHSSLHLPDEKNVKSPISFNLSSSRFDTCVGKHKKAKSERDPKREVVDWNWLVCQESRGSSACLSRIKRILNHWDASKHSPLGLKSY